MGTTPQFPAWSRESGDWSRLSSTISAGSPSRTREASLGSGCARVAPALRRTVKMKRLPAPGVLSRRRVASHQLNELPGCRPVPGPAVCFRVVEPSACSKGLNNRAAAAGSMPIPVSRTCHLQRQGVAGPSRAAPTTTTSPWFGELDGVADQVDEDLPQARRIADQASGLGRRSTSQASSSPLLRARAPTCSSGVARPARESKSTRLELEPARLDLREVEDVVDDRAAPRPSSATVSRYSRCSASSSCPAPARSCR